MKSVENKFTGNNITSQSEWGNTNNFNQLSKDQVKDILIKDQSQSYVSESF